MDKILTLSLLLYVLTVFTIATSEGQNVTLLNRLSNFSCNSSWECQPGGNHDSKPLACSCDEFCNIAGDCCQGYQSKSGGIFDKFDIDPENMKCLTNPLVNENFDILSVYKCPSEWKEDQIRRLCEDSPLSSGDLFQTIHVSGVYSGLVYKNQYCAMCNKEKFKIWSMYVGCNSTYVTREDPYKKVGVMELLTTQNSNCAPERIVAPTGFEYRKCPKIKDIVDTCPLSFADVVIKDLCEKVKGNRMIYLKDKSVAKNVYCGYCNEGSMDGFTCFKDVVGTRVQLFVYPFSVLFDLDRETETESVICEENQVYDPFSERCRDAVCNGQMVYRNGKCTLPLDAIFGKHILDTDWDCPQIVLDKSEFSISDTGKLTVTKSGYVYPPGDYKLIENDSSAIVCTNFTQNSTTSEIKYTFDQAQSILTLIGVSLSIIGCLMTISVYLSFSSLRNIPGKIVISLCIALVLGYLTLLIGPAMQSSLDACKSFAIIMHFAFLLAFFWMNVMAIDVWYTFSKAYYQAGTQGRRTNRFKFYLLYAVVMAAIPVILAIIINETEISDEFSPHYGEGICWIAKRNALMVFFGLPSLLIVTSNVVLFIIAARTIYVAQKSSARLLGKEDKGMLGIYVRLTCVMGLTYLFGYLAPVIQHEVLWYLFIILNTLQGVFIFISFVCTHKVIGLARERASTWSNSRSDHSFSGSRTTTKSSVLSFKNIK